MQIKPGMDTGRQTIACNIEIEQNPIGPPILIGLEFDVVNNSLTALPGYLDFGEAEVGDSILRDVSVSSSSMSKFFAHANFSCHVIERRE